MTAVRNVMRELTERDAAALGWLGEMYGARLDTLGVLLGRLGGGDGPLSVWGTRNQVARWQEMRLVTQERVLGATWVTPTRRGLDRAGLDCFQTWKMPVTRLAHTHAVAAVRLAYEASGRQEWSPWISEREIYRIRGELRWHIPDGMAEDPGGDRVPRYAGFEIELSLKTLRGYRTEVFGNLRRGMSEIRYFTHPAYLPRLTAMTKAAMDAEGVAGVRCTVGVLPEVPGLKYMGAGR